MARMVLDSYSAKPEDIARLKSLAIMRGMSKAALIREAITKLLQEAESGKTTKDSVRETS